MNKQTTKTEFLSFSFSDQVLTTIEKLGYQHPTDIQLESIPSILQGSDVLARADTGSGKTAAYVLPLVENLGVKNVYRKNRFDGSIRAARNCIQVLVLVPTRELAIQVAEVFKQSSVNINPPLKCISVYGGVKINPQMMALRGGSDILVATPGRLLDLAEQNAIKFNQIKALVIDEVDRMMKGDFQDEIQRITKLLPNNRQNLMFTATFPDSIRPLVREVMQEPHVINIDEFIETTSIKQRVIAVNHNKKNDLLAHLLKQHDWQQVLIFCSAKRTCDNLVKKLEKRGIEAIAIHGNKEQSMRSATMKSFKAGITRILIATDVAARGIDIDQLPCVINFDPPRSPNDYTHRIGRTGRAGQAGLAISLIAHHEYHHFSVIEKHNNLQIQREEISGFETDEIAPPLPQKQSKKKNKASNKRKLSKKQRQKQSLTKEHDADIKTTDSKESSEKKEPAVNAHIWGTR